MYFDIAIKVNQPKVYVKPCTYFQNARFFKSWHDDVTATYK